MTYDELVKINNELATVDIKGKDYAVVNERIKAFRQLFPNGTISTEIISVEDGVCIIKATVMNEEGAVLGTGHAYEKEGSSFINKTSYIENAETSAVGRALGMVGIGIDVSVASYEEVANARLQQNDKPEPQKKAKKVEKKPEPKIETAEDKPKRELTQEDITARQMFLEACAFNKVDASVVSKKFNLTNDSTPDDFYNAIENMKGGINE